MPRYIIERDIPEIGTAGRDELREAAENSNTVLNEMKAERKIFNGSTLISPVIKFSASILSQLKVSSIQAMAI